MSYLHAQLIRELSMSFIAIEKRSIARLAGRATLEMAIDVLVLSLCVVMAGSGDLEVVRIIRYLRSRVGANHPTGKETLFQTDCQRSFEGNQC